MAASTGTMSLTMYRGSLPVRTPGMLPEELLAADPQTALSMYEACIQGGADIITTGTFNCNTLLSDRISPSRFHELTLTCTRLADGARRCSPVLVAGNAGPSPVSLSLVKDCHAAEMTRRLVSAFRNQIHALIEGGADFILLETFHDLENIKVALESGLQAIADTGREIPVALSLAVSPATGRLYSGHSLEESVAAVAPYPIVSLGLNCMPPDPASVKMLSRLCSLTPLPLTYHPNAGLPDSAGIYPKEAAALADHLYRASKAVRLCALGGCCGARPETYRILKEMWKESLPACTFQNNAIN